MANQSTRNSNERRTGFSAGAEDGGQQQRRGGQSRRGQSKGADGFLERGNQQLRDMVEDHEGQTVLVALALGFGIGLAIGYSISPEPQHRWTDRVAAEGVGRRLLERFDALLPESISSKLG